LVAAATFVFAGAAFLALAWDVTRHHGTRAADIRLLSNVVNHRTDILTSCARAITRLGTGLPVYGVVIGLGLFLLLRRRTWRPLVLAVGFLLAGVLLRWLINRAIARPRPPRSLWLTYPGGYSFPSGHTATATIGYGLAAWLVILAWPRLRSYAIPLAVLLPLAVGLSRVYLGVHWPTDVLAGWLFGIGWLALATVVIARFRPLIHSAEVAAYSSVRIPSVR
jgi:membrane-associated phospholipid phosphatase